MHAPVISTPQARIGAPGASHAHDAAPAPYAEGASFADQLGQRLREPSRGAGEDRSPREAASVEPAAGVAQEARSDSAQDVEGGDAASAAAGERTDATDREAATEGDETPEREAGAEDNEAEESDAADAPTEGERAPESAAGEEGEAVRPERLPDGGAAPESAGRAEAAHAQETGGRADAAVEPSAAERRAEGRVDTPVRGAENTASRAQETAGSQRAEPSSDAERESRGARVRDASEARRGESSQSAARAHDGASAGARDEPTRGEGSPPEGDEREASDRRHSDGRHEAASSGDRAREKDGPRPPEVVNKPAAQITETRVEPSERPDRSGEASRTDEPAAPRPTGEQAGQTKPQAPQLRLGLTPQPAPESAGGQRGLELEPAQERAATQLVARGMLAAVGQRGGTMTLRLNPPTLGEVRIEVSVNQGVVNARFEAGQLAAQELIARNIDALRGALESRGFGVERLTAHVSAVGATNGNAQSNTQHENTSQSEERYSDGGGRDADGDDDRGGFAEREDERRARHGAGGADPSIRQRIEDARFESALRVRLNTVA